MAGLAVGLDTPLPFLEVDLAEKTQAFSCWVRVVQKGGCGITIDRLAIKLSS